MIRALNINYLHKTEAKYSYKPIFSCIKEFQVIVREVFKGRCEFCNIYIPIVMVN